MVMEMETSAVAPTATLTPRDDVDMDVDDAGDFVDDELEATQCLEEEETDVVEPPTKPTKPTPETAAPTTDESFDVSGASASAKPFAAAFGTVWSVLQSLGWQTAQGPGTEFVSMPDTQFFNFRPNINVFDAKGKACWKWLALSAAREHVDAAEVAVWETLWTIAESQFGWYTMSSGNETWYVKPNTSFTEFQPNVTIFQTKKRAVLQALAVNKVKIELGDSVEGKQVLDFAAKPDAATPKPKAKKEKSSETPTSKSDSFTTPPPKKSSLTAASSTKKSKATPTASAKKAKKTTPAKKTSKSPKTPKSVVKKKEEDTPLQFHVPEFKCTFAHVYKQLQMRGWHHKPGAFEYDYFSPDYTKETQILNGNYFQSAAEFEGFLKDSGMWADVEAGLRDEHAALVEELREEAEERRRKQKARNAARDAAEKSKPTPPKEAAKSPRSPSKKKKSAFKASMEASIAAVAAATPSPGTKRDAAGAVKISMGKVVEKLVKRGWYYRPGRFEYDYFKPNVTSKKNAIPGEDFFQSLSELEEYLKTTDLWDDLAQEIRNDADKEEGDDSDEEETTTTKPSSAKKQRVESPQRTEASGPLMQAAAALSSDIWGNSHQIDFERY